MFAEFALSIAPPDRINTDFGAVSATESVSVTLHAGQTRHDLTVADTGPGLPPGFQDRMFERFARAPRDSDVAGHGLGLALVQAIALRHGARISLPPVDRGFAIRISWPAVPQDI